MHENAAKICSSNGVSPQIPPVHFEYTSSMFVFMKSAPTSAENGDAMGGVSVRQIRLWIRHQFVYGVGYVVYLIRIKTRKVSAPQNRKTSL